MAGAPTEAAMVSSECDSRASRQCESEEAHRLADWIAHARPALCKARCAPLPLAQDQAATRRMAVP